MFGFGPHTLKKKSKIANLLQVTTSVFYNASCNYFLSKANIQVDPKFNIPITPYIESMLPYW
jgi:hypothetical protein